MNLSSLSLVMDLEHNVNLKSWSMSLLHTEMQTNCKVLDNLRDAKNTHCYFRKDHCCFGFSVSRTRVGGPHPCDKILIWFYSRQLKCYYSRAEDS
jgi:hypothetical protein